MEQITLKTDGRKTQRQSNFELLRIFAMLLIIGHHFAVHSGFVYPNDAVSLGRLWIQFLTIGGKLGVNIFVLISGWFLSAEKHFRTKKAIRLWLQIFTYAAVLYVIFIATCAETITYEGLKPRLFPVTFINWWFASAYFVLLLFTPFLNRFLHALSKRQFLLLLCLCGTLWCIIPTVSAQEMQCNNLLWFMSVYALAAYLRMYAGKPKHGAVFYLALGCLCALFIFASAVVLDFLGVSHPFFRSHTRYFYGIKMLPNIASAVFFLIGFSKIDIGSVRWINVISSAVFGVYLLHDDPLTRPLIWEKLFACSQIAGRLRLIPISLLCIAAVFVCCTAVELLRICLLERLYMPLVERLSDALDRRKEKLLDRLSRS